MARQAHHVTTALCLLALVSLHAVSARSLSTPGRALLAASPGSNAGDSPQTCCSCKCVIPSQRANCKPGMLCGSAQALPPSYSKKKICKDGFSNSCEDVCLVNRGSWKEYNPC